MAHCACTGKSQGGRKERWGIQTIEFAVYVERGFEIRGDDDYVVVEERETWWEVGVFG